MSDNTQALFGVTADDAVQIVHDQFFAPAFFAKLAEHGIVPQTAEEQIKLLDIAAKQQAIKIAASRNSGLGSLLDDASEALASVCGQYGVETDKTASAEAAELEELGVKMALARPDLAAAVCAFGSLGG